MLASFGAAGGLGYGLYNHTVLEAVAPAEARSASVQLAAMVFDPHLMVFWLLPVWLIAITASAEHRLRTGALVRHGSRLRGLTSTTATAAIEAAVLVVACGAGAVLSAVGLDWSTWTAGSPASPTTLAWLETEVPASFALIVATIVQCVIGLVAIAAALIAWNALPERRAPGLMLSAVGIWVWSAVALLAGGTAAGVPSPTSLLPVQSSSAPWLHLLIAVGTSAALILLACALAVRSDEL